jgi:hypothetical protein
MLLPYIAFAAPIGVRGPARPAGAGAKQARWNEAEYVFSATLLRVDAGPVGRSFPPMYTHTLHLKVDRVLRGALKPGDSVTASHVARQHQAPTFPVGKTCVVAASRARGQLRVAIIEPADEEKLARIEQACSLPLGWKIEAGKPVSPWAAMGPEVWTPAAGPQAELKCSKTGRPALLAGPDVRLDVEPVPPREAIKWTNPDGDGEYKLTVTNTSDRPIAVPALLSNGDEALWRESLVILCQGRAYPCPGARGVKSAVKPTTLAPGRSVSTVVNALKLEGPEWPRGGYRIEFQFCLGEKSRTKSFYYMSRHHDKVRAEALKGR